MTTGTHATARMLFDHYDGDEESYKRAPNGFRKIGVGCYRMAILDKSTDTVYKIGNYSANVSEAANSRRLSRRSVRNLGFELRIPATRTYRMPSVPLMRGGTYPRCVVAQEFAKGAKFTNCNMHERWYNPDARCTCRQDMCYSEVLDRIGEWSELSDIHEGNVLVDKAGVFWLIDLAC